jgi:mono/diheme cytochrome c family protein
MPRFGILLAVALVLGLLAVRPEAKAQPSNAVASNPVYVPDYSHANRPLPAGVLTWDAEQKTVTVTNGDLFAHFFFSFTNVSATPLAILEGTGSCSCTTLQLPPLPWLIPPGGTGQFGATINLEGKTGILFKTINITTDQGAKVLLLRVNIQPPPPPPALTPQARAAGVAAAQLDRQAVFRGDCANCHAKNLSGKFGAQLFAQTCAVCHEANPRATMVPDLRHLPTPTSEEFWRTWITSGKAGTLMPAFATAEGGPLDDLQITSLANYLASTIPALAPPLMPR